MDALPYYKWNWQDWRASRRVQRMTYIDRGLYRELLDEQWKEGTLPTAMEDLADICGCPVEVMTDSWNRLRFHFEEIEGRISNSTLEKMRTVTDAVRVANARNGQAGAMKKLANASQDEANADERQASASERQTVADERHIEEKTREEKTPSRAKKLHEGPTKTDIAKTRHAEFKAAIGEYWVSRNTIEMPWGPAEGRNLEMWLRQTPNTTLEQFKALLRNRFRSEVNHSERPSRWIGNVTGFATGPLDKFGRPKASAISAPTIRYSDPEAMNAR